MANTESIIEAIGRDKLIDQLKVTRQTINHTRSKNEFPASWYFVIKRLAKENGIDAPDHLFNMKEPATSQPKEAAE